MIQEAIQNLIDRENLSRGDAAEVMEEIMGGRATDAQIAAFLIALRTKGETVEEIAGCARVMREKATRIDPGTGTVVDTCGTGGDASGTFNISTAAAFLVAGAGVKVAKHGNRSVSSKSGSADVLECLGVNLDAPPEVVERCMQEANIGFLFAPKLHAAMKYAIGPRKEIGVRTIFNILGPLTNPARATHQLMGVYDPVWTEPIAEVLGQLGSQHAMVVNGLDGLDEISTTGPTWVSELKNGEVVTFEIGPEQFGLPVCTFKEIQVEEPEQSAALIREVLEGKAGAHTDIALLNAGAAIYVADEAESIEKGLHKAGEAAASGAAAEALNKLVEISNG